MQAALQQGGATPAPGLPGHVLDWLPVAPERQLAALMANLQASGGVMGGDAVVTLLREHREQSISWLARSVVRREIVHVSWREQLFVPMFQFDRNGMKVHEVVRDVLATLTPVLDDWALATWFAEPNARLRNRRPADIVGPEPQAVREAARLVRRTAAGA